MRLGTPAGTAGASDETSFGAIRRRLVLEGCKWDPQLGDDCTIGRQPLLLREATWARLAAMASALSLETMEAEDELAGRPELYATLGVPPVLRRLWSPRPPAAAVRALRLMRFDFHLTADGWQVSEVNSDVPGGFAEASLLPSLFLPLHPTARAAGNPAEAWVGGILDAAGGQAVALLSAPGFMEDLQVVSFLARSLRGRGSQAAVARVEDLLWEDGRAFLRRGREVLALGAVVRFVQAEWLLAWPRPRGWRWYFQATRTPVVNAGTALLTESKRFPLAWPRLRAGTRTWRALAPESREPAGVPDAGWLLKGAFSNNGDAVIAPDEPDWRQAARRARRDPARWVMQRRFVPVPIDTPLGPRYPCLGVYTLGGEPAGVYGRLSATPTIRHDATDVAVLVEGDGP
jgi:hypothetical protein